MGTLTLWKIKMRCVKCGHEIDWFLDRIENASDPTGPYKIKCECGGLIEIINKVKDFGQIDPDQ